MAVYTCNKCLFTFERAGEVEHCPDCGSALVHEATEAEITAYKKIKEEEPEGDQ